MTITTEIARRGQLGTGVKTDFPYPFQVDTPENIIVSVADFEGDEGAYTPRIYGTDFLITGLGNSTGGFVIFKKPPILFAVVILRLSFPHIQLAQFRGGPYLASKHEKVFDDNTRKILEVNDLFVRSHKITPTSGDEGQTLLESQAPLVEEAERLSQEAQDAAVDFECFSDPTMGGATPSTEGTPSQSAVKLYVANNLNEKLEDKALEQEVDDLVAERLALDDPLLGGPDPSMEAAAVQASVKDYYDVMETTLVADIAELKVYGEDTLLVSAQTAPTAPTDLTVKAGKIGMAFIYVVGAAAPPGDGVAVAFRTKGESFGPDGVELVTTAAAYFWLKTNAEGKVQWEGYGVSPHTRLFDIRLRAFVEL
jgi:hypothetical protein